MTTEIISESDVLGMVKEFRDRYFEMKREAGKAAASAHCHEFACMAGLLPSGESLDVNHGSGETT